MEKLIKAINFAARHHAGDFRKGTDIPYISHPFGAMNILMKNGINEENILIAALFHDLLEDTKVSCERIYFEFGFEVLGMVLNASELDRKLPWKDRKLQTINKIDKLEYKSKLVSLADKTHNLLSIKMDQEQIGDEIYERFNQNKESISWYYRSLVDEFGKDEEILKLELYKYFCELALEVFSDKNKQSVYKIYKVGWTEFDDGWDILDDPSFHISYDDFAAFMKRYTQNNSDTCYVMPSPGETQTIEVSEEVYNLVKNGKHFFSEDDMKRYGL